MHLFPSTHELNGVLSRQPICNYYAGCFAIFELSHICQGNIFLFIIKDYANFSALDNNFFDFAILFLILFF